MKDFQSFTPAVCAAGAQTLGHYACGMVQIMSTVQKITDIYKRYGIMGFYHKLREKLQSPVAQYDKLRERFFADGEELDEEAEEQEGFSYRRTL